jgi:hypothetical protein
MTIEIYEKATGRVVTTQEIKDMRDFKFYWDHQCDKETYGWRVKE